jgi:predicted nucleotidyltransferase
MITASKSLQPDREITSAGNCLLKCFCPAKKITSLASNCISLSGIIKSMRSLSEIQQILRETEPFLAEEYGVRIIWVFGSYVRQEQRSDSDLDLLIELDRPPKISLIGLVELEDYLTHRLGVKVDLAI